MAGPPLSWIEMTKSLVYREWNNYYRPNFSLVNSTENVTTPRNFLNGVIDVNNLQQPHNALYFYLNQHSFHNCRKSLAYWLQRLPDDTPLHRWLLISSACPPPQSMSNGMSHMAISWSVATTTTSLTNSPELSSFMGSVRSWPHPCTSYM